MKFTLFLVLLFTVAFATTETTLETSEKLPLRLITRCKPKIIERDVLCGCYVGKEFGLSTREMTRRCMMIFRAGMRKMLRSCAFYMRGTRIRSRKLIKNLTFIRDRCPAMMARAGIPVAVRLTPAEIVAALADIFAMVADLLAQLVPPVSAPPAGTRMLTDGGASLKTARLTAYNKLM